MREEPWRASRWKRDDQSGRQAAYNELAIGEAYDPVAGAQIFRVTALTQARYLALFFTRKPQLRVMHALRSARLLTINQNPRVSIPLRIEPEDGSPAFDTQKTVTVSRVAIPRAGDRFPVWYDREDPATWVYGTDMDTTAAAPAPAGTPAASEVDGPADELAKLNDLRMKGVLTDPEFEAAKARIPKELTSR